MQLKKSCANRCLRLAHTFGHPHFHPWLRSLFFVLQRNGGKASVWPIIIWIGTKSRHKLNYIETRTCADGISYNVIMRNDNSGYHQFFSFADKCTKHAARAAIKWFSLSSNVRKLMFDNPLRFKSHTLFATTGDIIVPNLSHFFTTSRALEASNKWAWSWPRFSTQSLQFFKGTFCNDQIPFLTCKVL